MIKNIIFDFGDVFINLDKMATARAMEKYGFRGITPELDEIFKNYEMGKMGSDEFLERTNILFPTATKKDLIEAWNAILLDFPEERLQFLEALHVENKYRLFLLSNTNEIHIENERQKMAERFVRFEKSFEVFYLSYEMGKRKPNKDIFEQVLDENKLIAEETFFIDDLKENTDAAQKLGIKTWNLQVGKEDVIQLKKYL